VEFSVDRAALVRELNLARGVVETKTTIPILGNVLIDARDGAVNIVATDLEVGIRCSCPATVTQPGVVTLPAKRLLDYVRLLPEADVQVRVKTTDNNWASLSCERSKARVAGVAADSFPELPNIPADTGSHGEALIPAGTLADAISKVTFAVSKEESRFTLKGALLILRDSALKMCATDGHRMALVEADVSPSHALKAVSTIVPLKALAQVAALIKESPDVTIRYSEDENHLYFVVGHRTLIARKMTGNFPDYERVLPTDQPKVATVGPEQLKAALERVSQFSDERSKRVSVIVSEDEITCKSAVSDTGDSEESTPATYSGGSVEIGFNATYLLDFLKVAGSAQVELRLKDASSAGELRPVGDAVSYRYVVMPMR
jgi:DNA polymerase III subunit beta